MSREKRRPKPDEPASAAPGSRMLLIPACPGDPFSQAAESIERLKRTPAAAREDQQEEEEGDTTM